MKSSSQLSTLRAEDLALMYSHEFTKANATATGEQLVNDLLDAGEVDEFKVWSNIVRLKEVATSADKAFRDRLNLNEANSSNGVTFTPKNGAKSLNYTEDPIYNELVSKVKAREKLLKAAQTSEVYDADGIEVPKVGVTFAKTSITVKY